MKTVAKLNKTIMNLIAILMCVSSCTYTNKECDVNYIGSFKIDMRLIKNKKLLAIVKGRKWTDALLQSDSSGRFLILTEDPLLKKSEGKWETSSTEIEGTCVGYLKQKNRGDKFSAHAFDVWIAIGNDAYIIPFRRID